MPSVINPEQLYQSTSCPVERRRIQEEVIESCRGRVSALVRRMVSQREHWREAEQVGAVGVIVALGRYDANRNDSFWGFAHLIVRDEIEMWMGRAIYWRPSTKRALGRTSNPVHSIPRSMDAELPHRHADSSATTATLHDFVSCTVPTAEAQTIEAELNAKLSAFLDTLTGDEKRLLLCEKRERANGGVEAGNNVRARRYLSLVERASAFVRGSDDDAPDSTSRRAGERR